MTIDGPKELVELLLCTEDQRTETLRQSGYTRDFLVDLVESAFRVSLTPDEGRFASFLIATPRHVRSVDSSTLLRLQVAHRHV